MPNAKPSLAEKLKSSNTESPPHLIVKALAGTGKTTTLVEGLNYLKGKKTKITPSPQQEVIWEQMKLSKDAKTVCFCSFSNTIVNELKERVPEKCEARTISSLGYQAVRNNCNLLPGKEAVNERRVEDLMSKITGRSSKELRRDYPDQVKTTLQLVKLCKMNLFTGEEVDELDEIVDGFELELGESRDKIYKMVPKLLAWCKKVDVDRQIDYDDMLWLPIVLNLPVPRFDLLLVDEVQDCNRCQHELAIRMGRRLILCGDPNQAIYQFAGAASNSMTLMRDRLEGCVVLPLTVTRRCGKAIVKEAQRYVMEFEAHKDNPAGKVSRMEMRTKKNPTPHPSKDYINHVQDGDMIICRVNAPLVSECFQFIRQGRKANIRGRSIGDNLVKLIEKLRKKMSGDTTVEFTGVLDEWATTEIEKENAKKNPSDGKIQSFEDRRMCLEVFCEEAKTVTEVIAKINQLFTDSTTEGILLSSVHKAKGTEADRVFYIQTPTRPNLTVQQQECENNIKYVGVTRAKKELVFVN